MLLVYIDESGVNYKKDENGYFKDGPYLLWTAIYISEKKYINLERSLFEISKDLLGIDDLYGHELHASNLWNEVKEGKRKKEDVCNYFDELFQLISKLKVNVTVGIQQKNPLSDSIDNQKTESLKARYSLLHLIEHKLAGLDETGILVADKEGSGEMKKLLSERIKWRYSPEIKGIPPEAMLLKPKFKYEFQSNQVLDQLHYVDSKDSLMIQLVDHVAFVLKRILEHLYLTHFPTATRPKPDKNYLPISQANFNWFLHCSNLGLGYYNEQVSDVYFLDITGYSPPNLEFEIPTTHVTLVGGRISPTQNFMRIITPYK